MKKKRKYDRFLEVYLIELVCRKNFQNALDSLLYHISLKYTFD